MLHPPARACLHTCCCFVRLLRALAGPWRAPCCFAAPYLLRDSPAALQQRAARPFCAPSLLPLAAARPLLRHLLL